MQTTMPIHWRIEKPVVTSPYRGITIQQRNQSTNKMDVLKDVIPSKRTQTGKHTYWGDLTYPEFKTAKLNYLAIHQQVVKL